MPILALTVLLQIAVPPPRGYVNDFAGVLDPASVAHMEAVITEVREKTRGEIAVVTLADIGERPVADVALQIGRQWGVCVPTGPGVFGIFCGLVFIVSVVGRRGGRRGGLWGLAGGGWRGGGGGGGGGGWGGGGGGFGGFGGGGGFSGGGAGGRF